MAAFNCSDAVPGLRHAAHRIRAWVLILHLIHAPVPCWDDPGAPATDRFGDAPRPQTAPSENFRWDVDVLLLGVDPPEDSDRGPFDGEPEHAGWSGFGAPYIVLRPGRLVSSPATRLPGLQHAFGQKRPCLGPSGPAACADEVPPDHPPRPAGVRLRFLLATLLL